MIKKIEVKIQIKNWISGAVLYESEKPTIKEALVDANLRDANLRGADLRDANLRDANLRGADLRGADLRDANLRDANLYSANLYGANLRDANLRDADLRGADLRDANLRDANLRGADLRGADLRDANLYGADLYGADLRGADLYGADLYGADLRDAENADYVIAQTRILPEGDIIGYKKCVDNKIVKLLIPIDAKRTHAMGRKCRAEYAKVLEITKNKRQLKKAVSKHKSDFIYKVGETVKCDKFDEDWTQECSGGIHFFITKLEAENYD